VWAECRVFVSAGAGVYGNHCASKYYSNLCLVYEDDDGDDDDDNNNNNTEITALLQIGYKMKTIRKNKKKPI
jgi:hypothetical protein